MLRKINMSRAVRTMQELFPEEYDFYPRSWILPEEYQQFATQVSIVLLNNSVQFDEPDEPESMSSRRSK